MDAPDLTTVQLALAQQPLQSALPANAAEPLQDAKTETGSDAADTPPSNSDPWQQDASAGTTAQSPLGAATVEQTKDAASAIQPLLDALPNAPATPTTDGLTKTAAAQPTLSNAPSGPEHAQHPGSIVASKTGANSNTVSLATREVGHERPEHSNARLSLPAIHAGVAVRTSTGREIAARVNTGAALPNITTASASVAGQSNPQDAPADATQQMGYAGQGAPAVALAMPSPGGDASSQSQDDQEQDAPGGKKTSQSSARPASFASEGDARVGMSGWIGSAQSPAHAASRPTSSDTAPNASAGMTNMGLDRIASESSARRLTTALHSNMNFGVQTEAFGKVNIQAALHGDQLASQISVEHAHLSASTLAAHMPTLESTLGEKYKLDATVTVREGSTPMGSGSQQSASQNDGRRGTGASAQTITPAGGSTSPAIMRSPERQQPLDRLPSAKGRLDLMI